MVVSVQKMATQLAPPSRKVAEDSACGRKLTSQRDNAILVANTIGNASVAIHVSTAMAGHVSPANHGVAVAKPEPAFLS